MTAAIAPDTREFTWRVEQGERERITIPVYDEEGNPYPVEGWTVDAAIKTAPGGTLLHRWPEASVTVTGNVVELTIPAPVSALWTWTTGWWRVVLTDPNSDPLDPDTYRVIQGDLIVDPD